MRSNDKTGRDHAKSVSGTLTVGILLLAGLVLCAGCSKRYIEVSIHRSEHFDRPAWVGVYYLSQETALMHLDNTVLSDPEGVLKGGAVVDKEVYSVRPGSSRLPLVLPEYDPEIRWVMVVAGFPDADNCAREIVPVKENAELTITVIVEESCIDLTWSD